MESLVMNTSFWKGRKVLITGHTGFKGSWLSLWLQSMGAVIRGVSLEPPTNPSLFEIANIANIIDHHIEDIRNVHGLISLVYEFKPEIVFHLAAQPLVRYSYDNPIETYATNVMGTVNVLESARKAQSVRSIVNITTDKCYENQEWCWGYRENEPMGGHDPYSSSKGCAELISSAYRSSFLKDEDIAMATVRAGNVVGGGDWAKDRLVPDILHSLENSKKILIRNPKAVRPWQHVLEPLSGYLNLAESLYCDGQKDAEGWNFGPRDEDVKPVKWVVEKLCEEWGENASWSMQSGRHPHEAGYLKLDISKARQRLQWEPRWTLETSLAKIVDWHKKWLAGSDMRSVCLEQISQYEKDR